MITHPFQVLGDLFVEENFNLLVFLFAPVLFLPLLAPRYLLPVVPLEILYLVADVPEQDVFGSQTVAITAFIFVATTLALAAHRPHGRREGARRPARARRAAAGVDRVLRRRRRQLALPASRGAGAGATSSTAPASRRPSSSTTTRPVRASPEIDPAPGRAHRGLRARDRPASRTSAAAIDGVDVVVLDATARARAGATRSAGSSARASARSGLRRGIFNREGVEVVRERRLGSRLIERGRQARVAGGVVEHVGVRVRVGSGEVEVVHVVIGTTCRWTWGTSSPAMIRPTRVGLEDLLLGPPDGVGHRGQVVR